MWPVDHHFRRHSPLTGRMGVTTHRLVRGLPDPKFLKEVWEVDPFWLILIKDGHTHTQPFNFSMYSCASESWTWVSSLLLQQKGQLHPWQCQQEKTPGVKARNLYCFIQYLWGDLEGHLHDLKPFILRGAHNLTWTCSTRIYFECVVRTEDSKMSLITSVTL